jgi:hypothetical protein
LSDDGERLGVRGNEFGTVTGRKRRCGWFDSVATRYSSMINGIDELAITNIDGLDILKGTLGEFPAPVVVLQSAAQVEGPFADEPNAQIDLGKRRITVPRVGSLRFYRLRSNLYVKVVRQQLLGNNAVLDFEYQPKIFALQSCAIVEGPYADESNVAVDSSRQTMSQSRFERSRFYRIRSDVSRRISAIRFTGENVLIRYGPPGGSIVLQSAPVVTGPYEDEPGAQVDLTNRTIASVSTGLVRFYRLRSDVGRRITNLRLSGNQVLLSYE